MPLRRVALIAAVLLCVPLLRAQDGSWIPRGMDAVSEHASFQTSFTFNKSMLDAASQSMPDDLRPIVAKLRGITVDSYRFRAPGLYSAADLDAVRAQYSGAGWQHLVTKRAHAESEDPVRTDLWVRMQHADVEGMVLMVANGRNIEMVVVDGMLSPLDLLHLRGHFGIPRFDGDDFVNAR